MVEWLSMECDNFLPDFKNEKTGEQIIEKVHLDDLNVYLDTLDM